MQPDRALAVEDVTLFAQPLDGLLDGATVVQGTLGEPHIEDDVEVVQSALDRGQLDRVSDVPGEAECLVGGLLEDVRVGLADGRREGIDVLPRVAALRRLLAAQARQHRTAEPFHLAPGVVDVVLRGDVRARGAQEADHGVTERGPSGVSDVQRTGGVGRDVLEIHDPAGFARAPSVCRAGIDNGAREFTGARRVEGDVEEAGTGDVDLLDTGNLPQAGGEQVGDHARRHTCPLGDLNGDVRGPVPVIPGAGALDADVRRDGQRQFAGVDRGLEGSANGQGQLFGGHPQILWRVTARPRCALSSARPGR